MDFYLLKYSLPFFIGLMISNVCLSQKNYAVVADSTKDSIFCMEHSPFNNLDSQTMIIGSVIPDQMVSYGHGSMDDVQDALKIVLGSVFQYDPKGMPVSLYVVIDSLGTTRGVIANTANNRNISMTAACIVFDYLKSWDFTPATLRGKPMAYGFPVFFRTKEETEIVSSIDSWPSFEDDADYRKLTRFLESNIYYDKTILSTKTICVRCLVDTLGFTHQHIVIRSDDQAFNNEALRVCRLIKFDNPAMQNGKPISIYFNVPVKFVPKAIPSQKKKACWFGRKR